MDPFDSLLRALAWVAVVIVLTLVLVWLNQCESSPPADWGLKPNEHACKVE